ncbi:hypothetical protein ACHAPA_008133 [Fusarium lateritium]
MFLGSNFFRTKQNPALSLASLKGKLHCGSRAAYVIGETRKLQKVRASGSASHEVHIFPPPSFSSITILLASTPSNSLDDNTSSATKSTRHSTVFVPNIRSLTFIEVSYADIAASGPKQTAEEAAAPQLPEIISDESASTASLVDVDMPSVHTVPNDFLEQEVQTETQAARIGREDEADARAEKRKRDEVAAKAKNTDNWLIQQFSRLSDGSATGLVIANFATVVGLSAYLGYKGWGLYEKGKLDWKAVGLGAGILASVTAAEGAVGRYLYKGKKGGS